MKAQNTLYIYIIENSAKIIIVNNMTVLFRSVACRLLYYAFLVRLISATFPHYLLLLLRCERVNIVC